VTFYGRGNPQAIGDDELRSIKTGLQPLQYVGDAQKLRSLFLYHEVFFSEFDQQWRPPHGTNVPDDEDAFLQNSSNVELWNLQGDIHKAIAEDDKRENDSTLACVQCNFVNDAGFTTCHQCAKVLNLKIGPEETIEQHVNRQMLLDCTFVDETKLYS
jgi:hypothetical protein